MEEVAQFLWLKPSSAIASVCRPALSEPFILRDPTVMRYSFILSRHSTSHRHASKARCFCCRSNTRSNMTRVPQKWMVHITLANMYNGALAELLLRFKEQNDILLGGAAEAVLLAIAVQIKLKYECPPALFKLGRTHRRKRL